MYMKKRDFTLLFLFMALFGLVACDETAEVDEFGNWQHRNIAYLDSIANVARANTDGDWKTFLAVGLNDTIEHSNEYYVYCNVLEEGDGSEHPITSDTVVVNYRGRLMPTSRYTSGYIFDETFSGEFDPETDVPVKLNLAGCVRGWITAMEHMVAGDVWRVYIPAELGYGASEMSGIPAYSMLVYELNLVGFYPKGTPVPSM